MTFMPGMHLLQRCSKMSSQMEKPSSIQIGVLRNSRSLKFPSHWVTVRFPRLEFFCYPLDWQLASRLQPIGKILSENWHPTNDIVLRVPLKVEFDTNLNGDISNFQIIEDPRSILTPAQKRQVGQCIRNTVYSCRSIKGANGDKQIHLVADFH